MTEEEVNSVSSVSGFGLYFLLLSNILQQQISKSVLWIQNKSDSSSRNSYLQLV